MLIGHLLFGILLLLLWICSFLLWYQSSSYEELCCTLNLSSSSFDYHFHPFLSTMSGGSEQTPSMDNFLYLHPNENPAVTLVSLVLDSTNYHSWSRSIEFVDGSAPEPPKTDRMHGTWRRCNNMVVSWIVHSVSTSI